MKPKRPLQQASVLGGVGLALSLATVLTQPVAQSLQLADGTVHFVQIPRLIEAYATHNTVRTWGSTYYFELSIPVDAGEPLQQVTISQKGFDRISFNLAGTVAYGGPRRNYPLPIVEVSQDEQEQVSVYFDPPVSPGELVTIGLRPYRNPRTSGVYLFGVTVYPAGEKSYGNYLGSGRIHFYDGFRYGFPW